MDYLDNTTVAEPPRRKILRGKFRRQDRIGLKSVHDDNRTRKSIETMPTTESAAIALSSRTIRMHKTKNQMHHGLMIDNNHKNGHNNTSNNKNNNNNIDNNGWSDCHNHYHNRHNHTHPPILPALITSFMKEAQIGPR
jgi:hypothetical protein